ncbi:MAG: hypothetical protein L0216_07425 [Planctomycetales bacterium]|nr:hypothetical protein [Planctomycetales bacterium]
MTGASPPASHARRAALAAASAALGVAALDLLLAVAGPVATEDVFWHVAAGRTLLALGGRPPGDPFSFTAAETPWSLQEWLFHVVAAAAHGAAGPAGLRVLGTALWLGAFAALAWGIRRALPDPALALAAGGLALVLLRHRVQVRPEALSVLGLGLLLPRLLATDPPPPSRGRLALLAAGVALWTNAHAVALVAPVLLALAAGGGALAGARGPALRADLLAAGVAAGATFATPDPLGPHGYALSAPRSALGLVSDEWTTILGGPGAGLSSAGFAAGVAAAALLLVGLLAPGAGSLRPTVRGLLPVLAALAAPLVARRFAWLLVLPAVLALRRVGAGTGPSARTAPLVLALAAGGLALADSLPSWSARARGPSFAEPLDPKFPSAAVERIRATGVEGNLYTAYAFGGYACERLWPRCRIFADGRTLQSPASVLEDSLRIRDPGSAREALLERHGVTIVLATGEFVGDLAPDRWALVHRDPRARVWVRRDQEEALRRLAGK